MRLSDLMLVENDGCAKNQQPGLGLHGADKLRWARPQSKSVADLHALSAPG
jgi:hypothetical protein